jgi:hypothetical protein
MMKTKSAPASEQRARILLSAWNSGDLRRLGETLTQDWAATGPTGWPLSGELSTQDERERMEMLLTIADAMRNWLRRGGDAPEEDLQVSMKLLRHLAGCESLWREIGTDPARYSSPLYGKAAI